MLRYQLLSSALTFYTSPDGGPTSSGPIFNVNLLAFHGKTPAELDQSHRMLLEYWTALARIIETKAGGQVLMVGEVLRVAGGSSSSSSASSASPVAAGTGAPKAAASAAAAAALLHQWHGVAIVYYPSLRAYHRVIADEAFFQIKALRKASIKRSVLYAATVPPAGGASASSVMEQLLRLNTCQALRLSVSTTAARRNEGGAAAASSGPEGGGQTLSLMGGALLVGEAGYAPWRHFSLADASSSAAIGAGNDGNAAAHVYFAPLTNAAIEKRMGRPMPLGTSLHLSRL